MEVKMSLIPGNKPGKVGTIKVSVNSKVNKDDELMNVETSKGNRVIKAPVSGVVSAINFASGDDVKSNEVLVEIEEEAQNVELVEVKMSLIPGNKPGIVGTVKVKNGDKVNKDDELMNVETTKGNRVIKAPTSATVKEVKVASSSEVKSNEVLVVLEVAGVSKEETTTSSNKEVKKEESELLILGGGPGGYVAALYASKKGLKVTLVEKNRLGGTCLNVGCIPTKALVKSSEVYNEACNMKEFGLDLKGTISYEMKNLVARKNKVVDTLVGGIDSLMKANNVKVIKGSASFIDDKTILVSGEENYELTYKDLIIATGSKIAKPQIPGIDLDCVLNSTTCLDNEKNLDSITIVGGGVIGMEFACLFANLGTKVTVVEFMPQVLAMLDDDIILEFMNLAKEKKIEIHTGSGVKEIREANDGKAVVTYTKDNKDYLVVSDKVLVATGRLPEMDGLNIDKTSLELNDRGRGIKVNLNMKTNVSHIYAIGDVTNIIQLAHVASHQGICAVDNILGNAHEMDYSAVPSVIFTNPEIASVGKTEKDCKKLGIEYKVGKFSYQGNGKALTMNKQEGFCKLIKDAKTDVIIGGAIIGADASSLVSSLAIAIQNKLTDLDLNKTIFAHPTTTEVIMEASLDLSIGALHN